MNPNPLLPAPLYPNPYPKPNPSVSLFSIISHDWEVYLFLPKQFPSDS